MLQPVQWGPGRKDECVRLLDFELSRALGHRQALERQWRDWTEQYRASAKQPFKDFPYDNAPNYQVPLTATDVDQMFAFFMQTIHAPSNLWTITPFNETWLDAAKPLQAMLEWLDKHLLRMRKVNSRVLMDMVKLGTGIYKVGWRYAQTTTRRYDGMGRPLTVQQTRSTPFVEHVKLHNFVLPPEATSHQPDDVGGALWVAERIRMHPSQFRVWAMAGGAMLPAPDPAVVDRIAMAHETSQTDYDKYVTDADYVRRAVARHLRTEDEGKYDDVTAASSRLGLTGSPYVEQVELWEINLRFATRNRTDLDDIILWYHAPTRTILRAIYQPFHHGQRGYEVVRYMPTEGFYGIGVCEQEEVFQKIQSDLANYQLMNALLANSRMWVATQDSGIMPGDPIFPGKVQVVNGPDLRSQFGVFPMADIYPSLPATYQQWDQTRIQRVGLGDLQAGLMEGLPSRTPATSILTLLQEGRRRPDFILNNLREDGLAMIGMRLIQLLQQFATTPVDYGQHRVLQVALEALGMPEGRALAEKLYLPLEDPMQGIGVTLTATSAGSNKETDRQQALALLQLANEMGPQFVQTATTAMQAMQMGMAPVALVAANVLQAQTELYKRVLEAHDVRDIEALVPDVGGGQTGLPDSAVGPAMGLDPGTGAAVGATPGLPGMGGVPGAGGTGMDTGGSPPDAGTPA